MKVHKDWIGSKKAATKGDLSELQEDIHADLQQFATKDDIARLERISESILKVVESIEGRLAEMKDHEVRIQRLEKKVFVPR